MYNGDVFLNSLSLSHFRNYSSASFSFDNETTIIVGPNTSGKSNFLEAIYLLSNGRAFRAQTDTELMQFNEDYTRVKGRVNNETELEVFISSGTLVGREKPVKKFLVNGVSKRRIDFAGNLLSVLFSPLDIDLISGSPTRRREFLDEVLEQIDREYRAAMLTYTKAIRQRNALLQRAKEKGVRDIGQFQYWDRVVIDNGQVITKKRQEFLDYINNATQDVFPLTVTYDHSIISEERLLQYKDAEIGAGVTLVGPHRDDFQITFVAGINKAALEVKSYGSRGQQRLAVLQLKMLQLSYIEEKTAMRPLLLLDDIFSELDQGHIDHVLSLLGQQQTIVTTTHKEFFDSGIDNTAQVIELKKDGSL